jgi:long-chain fatty acid transport protein
MKKLLLILTTAVLIPYLAYGGGIVTNTNQSAAWVRTMVRDASTDIDAVYFNPAGLTKLEDGFHFSLNNQTIWQTKDVTATYPLLMESPKLYRGEVKAPVFPSIYAAWTKGKIAVSFGFNPIGGGGGAVYNDGLFSFEKDLTLLVPSVSNALAPLDQQILSLMGTDPLFRNITGYGADIYFEGTSNYFGYQLGVTYELNDMISLAVGARFVSAKNTYSGYIRDITITAAPLNPALGGTYAPGDYIRAVGGAVGVDLSAQAAFLDAQTADREVNAEEKGSGFTPIVGANLSFLDNKLDIGLKYEFKTIIDLNTTIIDGKDGGGLFVEGDTVHNDMPAMLSVGVDYNLLEKLTISAGVHYYWDMGVNYGKSLDNAPDVNVGNDQVMDNNYYEIGIGLEYCLAENIYVSGGYLLGHTGVTEDYQSDLSYSLSSSSFGVGVGIGITKNIMLNLGGGYSIDQDQKKTQTDPVSSVPYTLEFKKKSTLIGIGLDISF